MTLSPGTRVGPYEVLAPLGAGGMGEVYRARDSRLKREVALKVLSHAATQDAERMPGETLAERIESRDGSRIFAAQAVDQPDTNVIHVKLGATQ